MEQLQVELEIIEQEAGARADAFFRKLESGVERLDRVSAGSTFGKDLLGQLDRADRRADQVYQSLSRLSKTDLKNPSLDTLRSQADRLSRSALDAQKRLQDIRAIDTKGKGASFLEIIAQDARTAEIQLDRLERRAVLVRSQMAARQGVVAPSAADNALLGGGLGQSIAAAVSVGVVTRTGMTLAEATRELADGQRILRAQAKETGLVYDELNAKAERFGETSAISNAQAQSTFAQLVNFANAAGRIDRLDEFRQRFSDLAAAKGINATQLGDIARQLNALTDEATDKLLNANPSAFYDKFAASLGKTAEKLTDAERRAAIFDEVIRKGAIFDGEAERRLNSSAGAVDRLNKRISDLQATLGKPVLNLAGAGAFLFDAITDPERNFLRTSEAERAAAQSNARLASQRQAAATAEALRVSDQQLRAASLNPFASAENFALSRVSLSGTFFNETERQKAITKAKEAAKADTDAYISQFQRALADPNVGGYIKFVQEDFSRLQNIFPQDVKEKIEREISNAVARGFEKTLSDPNATVGALTTGLKTLREGVDGLASDAQLKLIQDFEKAIRSLSDRALALRDSVRETLVSAASQDNPLVKLMDDFSTATDRAQKRFGQFGGEFVRQMADIDRAQIQAQINQNLYASSRRALNFEQEARRLRLLPDSQTDGFSRRLGLVGARADFASSDIANSRAAAEAAFFARNFNPNNPRTFDQFQFGFNMTGDQITIQRALDAVKALGELSDEGTGVQGRGLIAQKIAEALPDRELLLRELAQGGARGFQARQLLDAGADATATIRDAARSRFEELLAQNEFTELARNDALEMIRNLEGSKLTDRQKISEFLAITGELGTAELTPELRRARITALGTAASQERQLQVEAAADQKRIADGIDNLTKQISSKGLRVDVGDQSLIDIEVSDAFNVNTKLGGRADDSDTRRLYE